MPPEIDYMAKLRWESLKFWAAVWAIFISVLLLAGCIFVVCRADEKRRAIEREARATEDAKPVWVQAPDGHWEQKPETHDSAADVAIILWFLL
jgi:heme/copper-type cytochrome/quinol oxidase subunit 2